MPASLRPSSPRRRGIALLITVMALTVISMLLFQIQAPSNMAWTAIRQRIDDQEAARALDSAPGLAQRILGASGTAGTVDSPTDEWAERHTFDIGRMRVEIDIVDCGRRFDLRQLLEESPDLLERNRTRFVALALDCGVDLPVAQRLADEIIREGEARRLEDTVFLEQVVAEEAAVADRNDQGDAEGGEDEGARPAELQQLVPVWLDDFLKLPGLAEEDRAHLRSAAAVRLDPVTRAETIVRFLDQVTAWRAGPPNINTASREVLLHDVPILEGRPEAVDDILIRRWDEPFKNLAQLGNIVTLGDEDVRQLAQEVRLYSTRFRITARARELSAIEAGRQTEGVQTEMVVTRQANGPLETVWRSP